MKPPSAERRTFAQLGIPFPLFEAPCDEAHDYLGLGDCSLCGRTSRHCFRLGIGCAVMTDCAHCRASNGLDADDRKDGTCRGCMRPVPFPHLGEGEIRVCHTCLRDGKSGISKDTELGMISWDQALEGVTHGLPGLNPTDFEVVPKSEDDWVGARLPSELMFELLRTPTFTTLQGERWLFCCRRPMVYFGKWGRREFTEHAPDGDGRRLFEQIVQRCGPDLWVHGFQAGIAVYVFRCPACAKMNANWDYD